MVQPSPRAVDLLDDREAEAARTFVWRVRHEVRAVLEQASLFGSKARGDARPDSDVDILLIFRWLPPDREPQATHAEWIADRVARRTGVPITTWSVSLPDLECGRRTPMLVDALEDSAPLWHRGAPIPRLPFTPLDAAHCVGALLQRVDEGSAEFREHLLRGASERAARRGRDDLVRLCTALLLSNGVTRPRRAEAVLGALEVINRAGLPVDRRVLAWAVESFGPDGRGGEEPVPPPRFTPAALAATVETLRSYVRTVATTLPVQDRAGR